MATSLISDSKRILTVCFKKHFSTPIWAYVLLALTTAALLIHGFLLTCDFTKNVGYSLLASLVAALLIDFGNTSALHESDKRQYQILKEELVSSFRNLREMVDNSYAFYSDDDNLKLSFYQRVDYLLDLNSKKPDVVDRGDIFSLFQFSIEHIRDDSAKLLHRLYNNTSLSSITDAQRKQVRQINNRADLIYKLFAKGQGAFAVKCIISRLLPIYFDLEPDEKTQFVEEYYLYPDEIKNIGLKNQEETSKP